MTRPHVDDLLPLGAVDFHVLLVLGDGPLYGYAIMKAVAEESGGAVAPEIGSLYRVLARLAAHDLIQETPAPDEGGEIHPGRERRYYGLTGRGRQAARAEAARLRDAVRLAEGRDLLPGTSGPGRP